MANKGLPSGLEGRKLLAKRADLSGAAPQLQRPMVRLARCVDRVNIVGRLDLPLAIDLPRVGIDEAEPVQDHLRLPSLRQRTNAHSRVAFQRLSMDGLARLLRRG